MHTDVHWYGGVPCAYMCTGNVWTEGAAHRLGLRKRRSGGCDGEVGWREGMMERLDGGRRV